MDTQYFHLRLGVDSLSHKNSVTQTFCSLNVKMMRIVANAQSKVLLNFSQHTFYDRKQLRLLDREKNWEKTQKNITNILPSCVICVCVCVCVWLTPFLTFLSFLGRKKKRKEKFVLEHVSNICNLLLPLLISFTFLQKTLILSVKRLWDQILQSKNCVRLQVNFKPELSYFIEKKLVCL